MGSCNILIVFTLLALASSALAYDPNPLQDFCVATAIPNVFVNGNFCKDPNVVNSEDFRFKGRFNVRHTPTNLDGVAASRFSAVQFPALNTMGVTMVRLDYAINGINPPHTHPLASEILTVFEGVLYAGFVTSNPDSRLFSQILYPGDVITFPKGLIHFQLNIGTTPAVGIVGQGSQNPGVIFIADAVFGSNPSIRDDLLAMAFRVDDNIINHLQARNNTD